MGVRVMHLRGADKVSSMARLVSANGNGMEGNGDALPTEALNGAEGLDETLEGDLDIGDEFDGEDGEDGDNEGPQDLN
jgi:hypothetical protein